MASLGPKQKQILNDARKKKVFTLIDVQAYYPSKEISVARERFETLMTLGHFRRETNKSNGEIIYISKVYEGSQEPDKLPTFKESLIGIPEKSWKPQIDDDEYKCPDLSYSEDKEMLNYVSTEHCESTCMGKGCGEIPTCPAYQNQKSLELGGSK